MANEVDKDEASAVNLDLAAMLGAVDDSAAGVDLAGWNAAALLFTGGAWVAGALEHSEDNGVADAWAAIPDADLSIPADPVDAAGIQTLVGIVRSKRYVRTTGAVSGAWLILGHERHKGERL